MSIASVALLAACGNAGTTPTSAPTGAPSLSASVSPSAGVTVQPGGGSSTGSVPAIPIITPSANKDGSVTYCDPKTQPTPTGPAVAKFGATRVIDAYCDIVNELMVTTHTSLITVQNPTVQDFRFLDQYTSYNGQQELNTAVPKALAGNPQAADTVWGLALYGLSSQGLKYPDDGGFFKQAAYSPATTGVDRNGKLTMTLTMSGDLVMEPDGSKASLAYYKTQDALYQAPLSVTVHLTLVPGTGDTKPWLIDSWTTTANDVTFGDMSMMPQSKGAVGTSAVP